MLGECERLLLEKFMAAQLLQIATMQPAAPDVDTKLSLMKEANEKTINRVVKLGKVLLPWADFGDEPEEVDESKQEAEAAEWLGRWERVFGKLDSPEVQAKLRKYQAITQPDDARTIGA